MPKFEIWCEGYSATGNSGPATQWAKDVEAVDFPSAVLKFLSENPEYQEDFRFEKHRNGEVKMSSWGCRLFDNRHDAQEFFG